MCGICGIFDTSGAPVRRETLEAMTASLRHRGPEDQGTWLERGIGLGHARLSIIDLSTGNQPMCNEDESVWISFNGEIFNYIELREELLARGHRFRTTSDTEVILHGYEEYGTDFFERMNGQWAFAIWNRQKKELLLCRDRVGIAPLFFTSVFTRAGSRVLFASEPKALFKDPEVPRELDPRGLAESFTFWTAVAPQSVFRGIRELPPGRWIRFTESSEQEGCYWELKFPGYDIGEDGTAAEYALRLRESLVEATRLRFTRSDVPVAAYLSGGIDSSVTTAIIRQFTDTRIKTFSLRFADAEFDEGGYQDLMVSRLGTDHETLTVSKQDIGEVFPDVVRQAEKPLLRTAPAPMFLLSRFVRDSGYKVVVTGEGSDEMLGGYDIFREALVRAFIARDPESARRPEIIRHLYPWLQRNPAAAPAFARSFFSQSLDPTDPALSHRPRWQSASGIMRLLHPDVQTEMESFQVAEELLNRMPSGTADRHPLSRAQWLEITTLLAGYLLASQGDRMLMAHGIEGRFPFLDPHFIDLAAELPPRYKILGLDEKYLLKYAFSDLVPQQILRRPKQPYRAPDAGSFFSSEPEWLRDITEPRNVRNSGLFNPQAVENLMQKCRRKKGQGMSNFDNMAVTAVLSTLLLQRQTEGTS
jgi:asparagine synthase (glutamine-hydrolysing)